MSRWGVDACLRVYLEQRFQRSDYEWEVRVEGERSLSGYTENRQSGLTAIERAIAELLGL